MQKPTQNMIGETRQNPNPENTEKENSKLYH